MSDSIGPLDRAAIERIDSTLLPQLERHHLRLLAHCLASFQGMLPAPEDGALPGETARRVWCQNQAPIAGDPAFLALMLEQLDVAAVQLEAVARDRNLSPMALSLEDLIAAAEDRRQD